jgi:5-formyltetrahydrofolate cyclo-ligase
MLAQPSAAASGQAMWGTPLAAGGARFYASAVDGHEDILAQKRALRARMTAWRAALPAKERDAAAMAVAGIGLAFLGALENGSVISAFAPMANELRLWPLLRRLAGEGHALALPVVQGKGRALLFRAWRPGDAMAKGVWGIAEPMADKASLEPDVVIAPLLAFDACGWRLGYGGGFYDRTLHELRRRKAPIAVGVAYDQQAVDAVPHLDYDERLEWVLTPSGAIKCTGA